MERGFLILAACGVICTDECFFWKVFWWPICCLDREAGNFNFFFAGCGFGSRSFLKDTKPLLSTGQLHQPQLPAALPGSQAHQAPPPGLHHPHPALDIRAVLQGEPWQCGDRSGERVVLGARGASPSEDPRASLVLERPLCTSAERLQEFRIQQFFRKEDW